MTRKTPLRLQLSDRIFSLTPFNPFCKPCKRNWLLLAEAVLLPIRLANVPALLIHGLGHAVALFLVTGNPRALRGEIVLEGLGISDLFASLLPGRSLPQFSRRPPRLAVPQHTPWQTRMVAAGGIVMNGIGLFIAWNVYQHLSPLLAGNTPVALLVQLFTLAFGVASLAAILSLPDLWVFVSGRPACLACGPAFAIRYQLSEEEKNADPLISGRLRDLVEILAREASTRGGQSAGFSVAAQRQNVASLIFDKVVKGKRQDIVQVINRRLKELINKAGKEGYSKAGDFEAVLLHLRYATGGATHWHNAHPHWYEYYPSMMHHRVVNGRLESRPREVFNMIAHNGDFDAVHLEFTMDGYKGRHLFTQQEARALFQTMMPWSTSQGNSDSRSLAEWVDFHYTQGLSFKALRYAYFTSVLDFNREILNHAFSLEPLYRWAEAVDRTLLNAGNAAATRLDDLEASVKRRVRDALAERLSQSLEHSSVELFLDAFEEAFYKHDLAWVMRRASRDLVGEFALMLCTTLEPRMGVFSLTQAFSLGINKSRGEIFGSAEPHGVTSALHAGDPDDEALQINLEDGQYATIEYTDQHGQDAIRIYDRAEATDDLATRPNPAANTSQAAGNAGRSFWFPVNGNPKIDRSTRHDAPGDAIRRDLREIPYILRRVVDSFEAGGKNFRTLEHLCELLFGNLRDPRRDPKKFDLVMFGVDFNQDLINEFALALSALLPDLKIRTENSGNVLKEMKRTLREGIGGYGPKTVFIGVSNSAQTQSTLAALRKTVELVGAERCFALTQSFLNSMSQALGQGYHPDDPLLPNTFVNLSHHSPDGSYGRRRSEAATLVPVATQAVLTEILIGLAQRALESRIGIAVWKDQAWFAIRHDLQLSDIYAFREFQSAVYGVEIPNRVGYNAAGEAIDTPDAAPIEKEAAARAENSVEFVRSYAIFALYIVIATLFGVPVFALLASPLQSILLVNAAAHVLDAALFLSALWLAHLGVRYFQGRPLLERIGARAELFIDRKYIARMVERYNVTLFSNAPGFLTPYFYWADTVRDALHRFGIRAHRGVVTIHRIPDERMGIEEANNAAEEAMVFAQIGGIRFNHGQPQSRDRVRRNSRYMNQTESDRKARPYQTVLSDSLESLRQKYNCKLSPETLRLINRRLIDLSDGLIFEFVVGAIRKEIIDQAVWDVVRRLPGSRLIYRAMLGFGVDLKRITGEADTANQALIQSTKHPVSPGDINVETMEPRLTFDALVSQEQIQDDQSLAILVFFENYLSISLNGHPMLHKDNYRPPEIVLQPGTGEQRGKLVGNSADGGCHFLGILRRIDGEEWLVIENDRSGLQIALPVSQLSAEQKAFLKNQLCVEPVDELPAAA